jgi:hypothetical protein
METENHPDPFREATQQGLYRAMQLASCVGTAAQVLSHHRKAQARMVAEKDERARRALNAQARAEQETARTGWAPALDPQWLRQADLHGVAQTWGAAMPYADRDVPWHEPAATTALHRSEERLRELHPYAMARYDRLRTEGMNPEDAMREAAPLFARHPQARDSQSTPRPGLQPGTGAEWVADDTQLAEETSGLLAEEAMELRGQRIVTALQAHASAQSREPLGADELHTVLETVTNLPAHIVERITRPGPAVDCEPTAPASAVTTEARQSQPWQHDFPVPIREVVATAAAGAAQPAAARPGPAAAPRTAAEPAARLGPRHAR